MKILIRGKVKPKKDNWYWRCPKCHTIGYHETEDGYSACSSEGWYGFNCPECGERIKDNRYLNRLLAWVLAKCKSHKNIERVEKQSGMVSVKIVK